MKTKAHLLISTLMITSLVIADPQWTPLFDGKSLTGWHQLDGKAKFFVQDDCLVGETIGPEEELNSFMCTDKDYADFILELEFNCLNGMNSGVQIRSLHDSDYMTNHVHGYQVEIDPGRRAWSGGIYDEARRAWLNTLEGNPAAQNAYKKDQWNHYRIEAVGDSIKTWVNGVQAADLIDTMTLSGFIGLQVHSSKKPGQQVFWKNIRILDLGKHVWKPVFDGQSLNGWKIVGDQAWTVADGAICAKGSIAALTSETPYEDFVMQFKFKSITGQAAFYPLTPKPDNVNSITGPNVLIDPKDGAIAGSLYDNDTLLQQTYPGEKRVWRMREEMLQFRPGDWNLLTVCSHGNRLSIFINYHRTAEIKDYKGQTKGYPTIKLKDDNAEMLIKDIEILVPEK